MSINLKEIERKAYRAMFQDGLWDIFLGLMFLNFPLMALYEQTSPPDAARMAVYLLIAALEVVFFTFGKRYITVPRMGLVKFGSARKQKLLNMRWVLTGSAVLGVIVFLVFATTEVEIAGVLVLGLFALNILVVIGLMAYFMDYERLYLYAVLFAVSMPLGEVLRTHAGLGNPTYVFAVTGGGVALTGVWLLRCFLRDYPLPPADASGEPINGEV